MKEKLYFISSAILLLLTCLLVFHNCEEEDKQEELRRLYEKPVSQWPKPTVDSSVNYVEMAVLPKPQFNVHLGQKKLGKYLFFDPRLSSSNQIACASCHDPDNNWTDIKEKSFGHNRRTTPRNSMTLENIWAQPGPFFWDGRANTLEHQVLFPIESEVEMNQKVTLLPQELSEIEGYKPLFRNAYGDDTITIERIQKALAVFERTITSKKTRFDRFMEGNYDALSDQEIEGLHLFRTKARCMNCHHGPFLTDYKFHNEGQHHLGKENLEDLGLYMVTEDEEDIGKFKTPSLRNVMNTRPWMHNGLFDDIRGIIRLYNKGMLQPHVTASSSATHPLPPTDPLLTELHLTEDEIDALVAFLGTLSSLPNKVRPPELPQ